MNENEEKRMASCAWLIREAKRPKKTLLFKVQNRQSIRKLLNKYAPSQTLTRTSLCGSKSDNYHRSRPL